MCVQITVGAVLELSLKYIKGRHVYNSGSHVIAFFSCALKDMGGRRTLNINVSLMELMRPVFSSCGSPCIQYENGKHYHLNFFSSFHRNKDHFSHCTSSSGPNAGHK